MTRLSLAFLQLHVQGTFLDLIFALQARNGTVQFLRLPSSWLLDEETKLSSSTCHSWHIQGVEHLSLSVEMLPVGLQESTFAKKLTPMLEQM